MANDDPPWTMVRGPGPVVALAVHAGHELRREVAEFMALSDADRLREEDPFTDEWATVSGSWVVARRSRFEVDFNRARERAVYVEPEHAWGLRVWRERPPESLVQRSLELHERFYDELGRLLDEVARAHGCFVVLDLHSYNHRRDGPDGPPADPELNPEVNLGTGTVDRARWGPLVERFRRELSEVPFRGDRLDVRENVKFKGQELARWVHARYPERGCNLAVEFKKTFMDEWTGEPDREHLACIRAALAATLPGLASELASVAR